MKRSHWLLPRGDAKQTRKGNYHKESVRQQRLCKEGKGERIVENTRGFHVANGINRKRNVHEEGKTSWGKIPKAKKGEGGCIRRGVFQLDRRGFPGKSRPDLNGIGGAKEKGDR